MRPWSALLWSLFIHLGLLGIPLAQHVYPSVKNQVELSFLPEPQQEPAAQTPVPRPLPAPVSQEETRSLPVREPPRGVLPRPVRREEPVAAVAPRTAVQKPQVDAVVDIPEKDFVAFSYRKEVKEHIRRRLIYPQERLEGNVRVLVSLKPDGALREARILTASDPQLAALCRQGIESCAPFPPCPPELRHGDDPADYEFLVQYRPS